MKATRQPAPRFLWQGLLIVLPVVVLAGAGLFSIRQDRAMARREAIEKAQAHADQTADILWRELTEPARLGEFSNHTFRIDGDGRLLFPPPAPAVPTPQPFDLSALDETQRRLWNTAQAAAADSSLWSNAITASSEFLGLNPPARFAAAAQYRLGVLLEAGGHLQEARAALETLASRYPEAQSESGLPLALLAEWKRVQITFNTNRAIALEGFCSNLVERPTFLTPRLLNEASKLHTFFPVANYNFGHWPVEWQRRELLRAFAKEALAQTKPPVFSNVTSSSRLFTNTPPVPKLFWFHAPDPNTQWLAGYPWVQVTIGGSTNGLGPQYRTRFVSAGLTNAEGFQNTPPASSPAQDLLPPTRFWLASWHEDGAGNYQIVCQTMGNWIDQGSRVSMDSTRWRELQHKLPKLPAWFGATVEMAGVQLLTTHDLQTLVYRTSGKGGGQTWQELAPSSPPEILATASRYEQGIEFLKVNIHLTSPQMLFARQRTRSLLFGGLIAASALAAIIGFISARRAFLRQQQLSEMKSNFVSSVSHELRAPIASVRLLAESLERGTISEPAKQHEYFRFIVQECRRLSSLIENVLDFARIEQGRKQYEFEPTDLPALIRQTVKLMEPAAAEKQIAIMTNLDDPQHPIGDLQLICDGSAIQQALINLIDNALKHSPAGETVSVALTRVLPASCRQDAGSTMPDMPLPSVQISVTDHGPGIPPEEHERIFERFYRRGSELRRETQGVGIGLSIVKHIAEAHGGRVRVESEAGKGSRFVLELPVKRKMTKAQ